LTDDHAVRLTNLWKPAAIALVLLAAAIYAGMVIHEISWRTQLGEERRAREDASGAFVEDEAVLGTIWAHQHHPYDASWCPDYSPSFQKGCVDAVASGSAGKSALPR
jgi:hypothetical protein